MGKSKSSGGGGKIRDYLQSDGSRDRDIDEDSHQSSPPSSPSSQHGGRPAQIGLLFEGDWREFLKSELQSHTSRICDKVDAVINELTDLSKRVSSVESTVDELEEKMASGDQRLQKEIDELKNKLLLSEVYSRRANLLVYGVADEIMDLDSTCRKIFKEKLQMGSEVVNRMLFVNIHRLPRFHQSEKPKPIIIKFVRMTDRETVMNAVFSMGKDLSKSGISIRTDLPLDLKKLRGRLLRKAMDLRKVGFQTKVREKGTDVTLFYRRDGKSQWRKLGENEEPSE